MTRKVAFASREWVDLARTVLEELVAEHGEDGRAFSVCEVFTDAPAGVAADDAKTAAWHFHIAGKTVRVGAGEIPDADFSVRADYAAALPMARLVYTPEMVKQVASAQAQAGAGPRPPAYLVELHNRLAVATE